MKALKSFEPDLLFKRPASPFESSQNQFHAHADIFERALLAHLTKILSKTAAIDARKIDGLLLGSAILFGALLDSRLWPYWLHSIRYLEDDDLEQRQPIWVDIQPPDRNPPAGFHQPRRWVADPLTHILLRRTLEWRWEMPSRSDPPAEAVAAFFRNDHRSLTGGEKADFLSALHQAAQTKWRMRMPAFLIDAASDSGESVPLPQDRWHAVFLHRGPIVSTSFPDIKQTEKNRSKDATLSFIRKTLPDGPHSPRSSFTRAARTLHDYSRKHDLSPVERIVLQWARDRIDPLRCNLQTRVRLAPSTIVERAKNLLRAGREVFGNNELRFMSRGEYIGHWNEYLENTDNRNVKIADLWCFSDWLQRRQPRLTVKWIDDASSKAFNVTADILSAKEYNALLSSFRGSGEVERVTRLMIVLGFRAGLRWPEVKEIDIADFRISGSHIELSVRGNSRRKLKTLASRRLIPLDLMLTAQEINDLQSWLNDRRVQERVGTTCSTTNKRNQERLFPTEVRPAQKTLNRAIAEITGVQNADYHILRHSCGSYLLSTLALPEDVSDGELKPGLDPSVVSHERRRRIAPALIGHGRTSLNAVHAVGALLGHSGETWTTRSYFHLHDWLVGIYVARPSVQRGLPTSLVSELLEMQPEAIERANRRAAAREKEASAFAPMQSRPRGRPKKGTEKTTGSIILSRLTHRSFPAPKSDVSHPAREVVDGRIPRWQSLAGIMLARGLDEQKIATEQSDFASPVGRAVVKALQSLLASSTRGRNGVKRLRFGAFQTEQSPHRLTAGERERLEHYHRRVHQLAPDQLRRLCNAFAKGYDQPRGVLRVPLRDLDDLESALKAMGCRRTDLSVTRAHRTATIKIAHMGCADRSFVWAMLFATAIERGQRDAVVSDTAALALNDVSPGKHSQLWTSAAR